MIIILKVLREIMADTVFTCTCCPPLSQTRDDLLAVARIAANINPLNAPSIASLNAIGEGSPSLEMLAAMTKKYWRGERIRLTVGFLDNPSTELRRRILENMNAWSKTTSIQFVESGTDPQVRITRDPSNEIGLYWSGIGTDILYAGWFPPNKPTMNLGGFTESTLDSEFKRVVRHETGHTLGFPHEHLRQEIVDRIDRDKAIAYYLRTNNWDRDKTISNVLTPFDRLTVRVSSFADPKSIMCYQLPAEIMRDGVAVLGGSDIDDSDYAFAAVIYPKPSTTLAPRHLQVTARNGLRLRTGPGLEFDIIQTMSLNTQVFGGNERDGFVEVDLQGDGAIDGWASSSFLRPIP
jgi:hypothetical protein